MVRTVTSKNRGKSSELIEKHNESWFGPMCCSKIKIFWNATILPHLIY